MNKIIIGILVIVFMSVGIYYFSSINKQPNSNLTGTYQQKLTTPTRLADINGYVLNIAGNEVTIANEIGMKEVTAEEQARRQKLTQEERQALKAQESANLTKENVILTIPVGVTIVKGTGDASGNNIHAEMSEISKGIYLSIWKSGDAVEFVKLKGVSGQ